MLVGAAAKWSLSSNALQHDHIKDNVTSLAEKDPENQHLEDVLMQATQYEED